MRDKHTMFCDMLHCEYSGMMTRLRYSLVEVRDLAARHGCCLADALSTIGVAQFTAHLRHFTATSWSC